MSARIRGIEATLRVSVDGQVQVGSFFKVNDWTVTPRQEITERDYCGEQLSDLDIRHDGYDIAFSVDMEDAKTLEFLSTIVDREEQRQAHPKITITATYAFRQPGTGARAEIMYDVFLKEDQHGAGGRKEYVNARFSGKCKKRKLVTV